MLQKLIYNFKIGIEAIFQNKLRGFLTSLGIIFGVASVIAMMAIGNGARDEILQKMKILGSNNIIIQPRIEQEEQKLTEEEDEDSKEKFFSPGLSYRDAESIQMIIPDVEAISPEVVFETRVIRRGLKKTVKMIGVEKVLFELSSIDLRQGTLFTQRQSEEALPVCIIGSAIKSKFFPMEDPLGKYIKCGNLWLKVIGVSKERRISSAQIKSLGIRDFNMDVYVPLKTALIRFKNRGKLTEKDIEIFGGMFNNDEEEGEEAPKRNFNQLDRVVVRMTDNKYTMKTADIISRMLERRHYGVIDFEIIIPELLIKQEQKTRDLLNSVLIAIASISLLVGGIGVMNIMLASVMERIKEIGIRLSVGATRKDIIMQFLSEAVILCVGGGVLGIIVGVVFSIAIEKFAGFTTIISFGAVLISFFVAALVGIIFGILPAIKAAKQNPVESLRHA